METQLKHCITAVDYFFLIYIASSKHKGGLGNSLKLCKPSTLSWVCITVSNSPKPLVFRLGHVNTVSTVSLWMKPYYVTLPGKAIEQSFKVVVFSFSTFCNTKFGICNLLIACESCLT